MVFSDYLDNTMCGMWTVNRQSIRYLLKCVKCHVIICLEQQTFISCNVREEYVNYNISHRWMFIWECVLQFNGRNVQSYQRTAIRNFLLASASSDVLYCRP